MGGMARISRRVFLAATPLLPLAPYLTRILVAQQQSSGGARLYVGTYTHDMGPGGKADGIYTAEWDACSGAPPQRRFRVQTSNQSSMAVPHNGNVVYANKEDEKEPQPNG